MRSLYPIQYRPLKLFDISDYRHYLYQWLMKGVMEKNKNKGGIMRNSLVVWVIILSMVGIVGVINAVPRVISYQGRLTDDTGTPLDGTYDITFNLYTEEATGYPIWTETHSNVEIHNGLYNVMLGSSVNFPEDVNFSQQYWLGIQVDSGEELTPRYQLGASPYALNIVDTLFTSSEKTIIARGLESWEEGLHVFDSTTTAISGFTYSTTSSNAGVYGFAGVGSAASGVRGVSYGNGYAVYGTHSTSPGTPPWAGLANSVYAGYFDGNVRITQQLQDSDGDAGTSGQVLSSTGSGTNWITPAGGGGLWTDNGDHISANDNDNVKVYDTGQTYVFKAVGSGGSQVGVQGSVSGPGNIERYGIYGTAGSLPAGSGTNHGVYGSAMGGATNYGIYGNVGGNPGYGVYASGGSGRPWAGLGNGTSSVAGHFEGDVEIVGSLSKGSGSFLIDHPLDPEHKLLRHNFVESPENLCLYRGKVKLNSSGKAEVNLPDYFAALTKEDEATITLTSIGKPFDVGYEWNSDYTAFTIYGESWREVSYIVLADRDDPVMRQLRRPVVEEKSDSGSCPDGVLLYPEAYGYPESKGYGHHLLPPENR